MKKLLILMLVMVLILVSISPALAGNGNGGGGGGRGNGHGRNGNMNNQQRLGTSGNGHGWQGFNVITGVIAAKAGSAESGIVTLTVYGGKDASLYGTNVDVSTDSSTRFMSKDGWEIATISFEEIVAGEAASVAIGIDGFADRITVGVDCPNIP